MLRPRLHTAPRRASLALLAAALAAGSVRAATVDWAADPMAARTAAYAASRAICRKLEGEAVPPGDRPTPAEASALADCSSEALYFGIGRPADPTMARLCASVETRAADPQVTDFGFTGDRSLMMVYANGVGAARNLSLATALACRAGGTPAEIDARVRHLARLAAAGWTGTGFSLCDDARSGLMRGVCADHDQLVARSDRARAFAALSSAWTSAERAAFAPLRRAAAAFVDARGQDEVDRSGPDREAAVVAVEERAERGFMDLLAAAEAGTIARASAADATAAGSALDAAVAGLMVRAPALARTTTLTAAALATAGRAWARYREAWMGFARVRYPSLPPDALQARLARDRAAQVVDVPASAE